jgi:hypothetical protein
MLFLVIGGAALYYLINQFKAPVKSGKAKVISKRHFRNPSNGVTSYRAKFEIENEIIELIVRYEMYNSLTEGEEGILSYKGRWLVSFEK